MKQNQPTGPKSFPILLEAALRHILPGVKHCDRWRDYRHFVEWQTRWERWFRKKRGYPASAPYSMEQDKATALSAFEFINVRDLFLRWRKIQISRKRSKSGRTGGKTRADNKRAAQARRQKKKQRKERKPLTG
jgi:hypothetical protein